MLRPSSSSPPALRASLARSSRATVGLALALALSGTLAACQGCRAPDPRPVEAAQVERPTVRIVALSSVAGALEPCGCSKDQLGGADHLAAWLAKEPVPPEARLVVGAGPLFFLTPQLEADKRAQDEWKAEALAGFAKRVGLAAWAPGANDWAAGSEALARYRQASGAALLAGNVSGIEGAVATLVREVGGVKVGLVGVAEPRDRLGKLPEGASVRAAKEAVTAGIDTVKKEGASVVVVLASIQRGEAMRVLDEVQGVHVMVVGKPLEVGEQNDSPKAPTLVGKTVVVETSNHLQTAAVVDLYLQGAPGASLELADAGGVSKAEEVLSLGARIRELEARINGWERGSKGVSARDIEARRQDLEKLREQRATLERADAAPVTGSYFRYQLVEVRDKLGSDDDTMAAMRAFYKRVNDHNRTAFQDRKPPPVPEGQAGYVGVAKCSECHAEERKVWDATPHSKAYVTLSKDFKEFNLECVSCHVTGYGKAGGSTVAHNEPLRGVQCEECHGPGSLHAADPSKKGSIVVRPEPNSCVTACHHPPHVEGFEPATKMELVLGPGHGR